MRLGNFQIYSLISPDEPIVMSTSTFNVFVIEILHVIYDEVNCAFWKLLYLGASFQLCMREESECKHWNKGDTRNNSIFFFFRKCLESLVFLAEILPKIFRFGDLIVRKHKNSWVSRLNRETWLVCRLYVYGFRIGISFDESIFNLQGQI